MSHFQRFTMLLAGLTLLPLGPNPPADPQIAGAVDIKIRGYVRLSDGSPLGGIQVRAEGSDNDSDNTDADGSYEMVLSYGFVGVVGPVNEDYLFDPLTRNYTSPVTSNRSNQNFTATPFLRSVRGNIRDAFGTGIPGVVVAGPNGVSTTDTTGRYVIEIPYAFQGTVTPVLTGWRFNPPSRSYLRGDNDLSGEDYTATFASARHVNYNVTSAGWWYGYGLDLSRGTGTGEILSNASARWQYPVEQDRWYGTYIYDGVSASEAWGFIYAGQPN